MEDVLGFFGVGPVSIGIPLRYGVTDRQRPLIVAEDAKTADEMASMLGGYGLSASRFEIPPDATEFPAGDLVVICGPKSARAAARLWLPPRPRHPAGRPPGTSPAA
jgi:hypothetical protein